MKVKILFRHCLFLSLFVIPEIMLGDFYFPDFSKRRVQSVSNIPNPSVFKAYDIRGEAESDLPDGFVYNLGRAFAVKLKEIMPDRENIAIGVGMDNRDSSSGIRENFIKGLIDSGIDVMDLGMIPKPVMQFSQVYYGLDGGVIITASHLTSEFNGLKFMVRRGEGEHSFFDLTSEEIKGLKDIIEKEGFVTAQKGELTFQNPVEHYIQMVQSAMKAGGREWFEMINEHGLKQAVEAAQAIDSKLFEGMKIVIDAGNGTTGEIAARIFEGLGAMVIGINIEPDANFPNRDPDPTHPGALDACIEKVQETDADLGIAYDPDGDRAVIVTPGGQIVLGDVQIAFLATQANADEISVSHVIFDAKSSRVGMDRITAIGIEPVIWKTGFTFIRPKMAEIGDGAWIAGETASHIFMRENFRFDDGIYASAKLTSWIIASGQSLDALVDALPKYNTTPEMRLVGPADLETRLGVIEQMKEHFRTQGYEIIDVDGVRVNFKNGGWALIRSSNTQPMFTFRAEAGTEEELDRILRLFLGKANEFCPEIQWQEWAKYLD